MNKVLFREEQKFRKWWYLTTLLGSIVPAMIFCIYSIYQQTVRGSQVVNSPAPNAVLVILFFVLGFMLWGSLVMKLEVWIDQQGIHSRFFPLIFRERFISANEIRKHEIRKYSAILDYGGWGVRRGFKWGRAYNVSGNIGLQLYLTNGKKVLFGTQRPQALMYAMYEMIKIKPETNKH